MTTTVKTRSIYFNWLGEVQFEHLIAGISGGVASTLILHPLDLIKIRFAVNDGHMIPTPKYHGIFNAFSTIVKEDGFFGLYRGVIPNVLGAASSWGLYFFFYNSMKQVLQGGDRNKALSAGTHLMCATEVGVITMLMTNPLWVIKTRMCLQHGSNAHHELKECLYYSSMTDALVKIYKTEGIRGYYKGLVPGLFGVSHGAVQFMTYEELKNRYDHYKNVPITTKLSTAEYLSFAAISKLVAVALTYPYQVVRARLQNQHYAYSGSLDCIGKTWKYEGWTGFYKGMGTNLLRVTPATMITFVTYENVSHFLMNRNIKK